MNMEFSRGQAPEVGQGERPSSIERAFAADIFEQELRSKQEQAWFDLGSDNWDSQNFVDAYYEHSAGLTAEYLENAGMTQDQPEYEEYYNIARKYSWDQMSEEEWQFGYSDEEHPENLPVSGRRALQREHRAMFGFGVSRDGEQRVPLVGTLGNRNEGTAGTVNGHETEEEGETERTLEELEADIRLATADASHAFATRMKAGFFARKHKKIEMDQVLKEKQKTLDDLVAVRDERLAAQLAETMDPEAAAEELARVMNGDADREGQGQRRAMIGDRTTGKILDWYSNLDRGEKIVLGLGVAATGAVLGTVAGCAGIFGGAALAGTRLVRSYAMQRAKLYEAPEQPEPISHLNEDGEIKSVQEMTHEAAQRRAAITNQRLEKGEKVKKWAAVTTIGSTALIGFGLVSEHVNMGSIVEKAKSGIGRVWDYFNGDDAKAIQVPTEPVEPGPGTGPQINPPGPSAPEMPGKTFDPAQFVEASTVEMKEGWYSTFNQLGITDPGEQYAMLHNESLMNQLKDMGLAYRDNRPEIGGWGMNMTPDGKLPPEALKTIRDMAYQSHYTLAR